MGQKDFEPADLIGVLRHLLSMSMLYNVYKNEWIKALDGHKKEDSHYGGPKLKKKKKKKL